MQVQTDSASTTPQCGRVMIVEDMQCNGVIAAIGDILQAAGGVHAYMNLNNRERFKVHYDEQFAFGIFNATATQAVATQLSYVFDCYRKVNIPVVYEGTANTIGSISSGDGANGVYWVYCCGNQ